MNGILRERTDSLTKTGAKMVLHQLRQAMHQSQRTGDTNSTAWALVNTSMVLRGQRKLAPLLNLLSDAETLFKASNDEFGLASVLHESSIVHRELGRDTLAVDLGLKAASAFQSLGRMTELAWAYNNLSTIYFNQSHRAESLSFAKKAHGIFMEYSSENGLAWNNCTMGMIYTQMGFHDAALQLYFEALETFERINSKQGKAWAMLGAGMVLRSQGKGSQSATHLNKARILFSELELPDRVAWCLLNLAALKRTEGSTEEAMLLNKEAIHLFTPLRNHDGVAWGLLQIGQIYRDRGLLVKAWQTFREGYSLHSDVSSRMGMGIHDNELGETYLEMGDVSRARECFVKAHFAADQMDMASLKAQVEVNMAWLHLSEGMIQKAAECLDRSELLAQKWEAKDILADVLLMRIRYWLVLGDVVHAKESLDAANALIETAELNRVKPALEILLGEVLANLGQSEEAAVVFQAAAMLAKKLGQRHRRAEALLGALQLQRFEKGAAALATVAGHAEKDVRAVGSRKLRAKFLAVKGVLAEKSKSPIENRFFHQSLTLASACELYLFEKQVLDLLLGLYRDKATPRAIGEFRRILTKLMDKGPADLHLVRPRNEGADLLPISLAV